MEFESVLAEMRDRVKARRASGEYPPGLETQLEAEFDAILRSVRRDEVTTEELSSRIVAVGHWIAAVSGDADVDSRVPGGTAFHRSVSRIVRRHTNQLADSVRAMGLSVHHALEEVVRVLDAQRSADERQLNEVVGSVFDRLAVLDHLVEAVGELERRMDEVDGTQAGS